MNWLFGMFLLGSAAVVFPFVFHLIRQTPKGRQEFSSLMFLEPTPPRLTRRSRLDDILLLILRGLVIVLLALAFTRPFWRSVADLSLNGVRGRRVAILLDTSASMRRGDLWNQAVAKAEGVLDSLEDADDAALFVFDRDMQTLVNFHSPDKDEPADKKSLIKSVLKEQSPSWHQTDLGAALIRTAEILDESIDREESDDALQIVLISDLQEGAQLSALNAYQWPDDVRVAIEAVSPADPTNAAMELIQPADDEPLDADPRIRVRNAKGAGAEEFLVNWQGEDTRPGDDAVTFYVPGGQTRTIPVARPKGVVTDRLVLTGDAAEFDNQYFVVPIEQETFRLAYLGDDDPDDAERPLLFLKEALIDTAQRKVVLSRYETGSEPLLIADELPHLLVIARALSESERTAITGYLEAGGHAFVMIHDQPMAESLGGILRGARVETIGQTASRDYRMLGQIDFSHPLFLPFAGPRYNDFTDIHFFNYRAVSLPEKTEARVIAAFDNQKPALWEQPIGDGLAYFFASSWHPDESQLAVSNKFLPLIDELLEECTPQRLASSSYMVGDAVLLPESSSSAERMVLRPDGGEFLIPTGHSSFRGTDEPGIYTLLTSSGTRRFAVNLAKPESETAPLERESLENLDVLLGRQASQREEYDRLRQLRDRELENKQKLWKWLVLAALVVVGAETWLAGRRARRTHDLSGESA